MGFNSGFKGLTVVWVYDSKAVACVCLFIYIYKCVNSLLKLRKTIRQVQNEFSMHHYFSKIKNIMELYRGIIEFKKGYQSRTYIVKDEKSDLFADSHSILPRWRNHFFQLLNVHEVIDVRQTKIHTAEPLVPQLSAFEVELTIEKLKSHRSPGNDKIPAELIKAGGRIIRCEIHKRIISIWNNEALPEEWKELIIVKGKSKAIPLHAWTDPEGSRRMRLPDLKTIGT